MLTAETKRKIDYLRDVLVGKIPVPSQQIEQITLSLIYKFMSDIDEQNEELGGKLFFSGEYKKYSWKNIMDRSLAGHERVLLYSEGLEKMSTNNKLPQLFRDIFKGAILPFKDPAILDLFLKGINEFKYDHSEELGNAFEYLLSTVAGQKKAGYFRTPRHIIDFIVEIVDPQKEDKILDPACGTAGFLIAAYKHILKNNTDKKMGRPGSLLTSTERKKLTNNIVGYDISHEMVRLSLVNLYLHGFAEPGIYEYNTLSSLERWDDAFDCLLANPPFMTPRGGIKPHNRFLIQSKRSEVLFVDYIVEHLAPNGKAGIIVPEGIIFQSGRAYKQLRKILVEDGLWAVVSLPRGVFNPYAGVKTSILFFSNPIARKVKEILFVKIENDGFDLGAQRREIDKNDLPKALEIIKKYKQTVQQDKKFNLSEKEQKLASVIKKEKIAEDGEYNLSINHYASSERGIGMEATWQMVELGKLIEFLQKSKRKAGDGKLTGDYPFFTSSQVQDKWFNVADYKEEALILGTGGMASVHLSRNFTTSADVFVIKSKTKDLDNTFLYYCLKNNINVLNAGFRGAGLKHLSKQYLRKIQIPLPPMEVQKQIVAELNNYQKIIDGAKQIIENYKPIIEINPEWEIKRLEEIVEINKNSIDPISTYGNKLFYYVDISSVENTSGNISFRNKIKGDEAPSRAKRIAQKGDILLSTVRPNLKAFAYLNELPKNTIVSTGFAVLAPKKNVIGKYIYYVLFSDYLQNQMILRMERGAYPSINQNDIQNLQVPLPPIKVQKQIIDVLDLEQKAIKANKELIKFFDQKIKNKILKLWK